jgi:hypothetical protein
MPLDEVCSANVSSISQHAYVMAHEIAHVLEGVSRHSAEGVMKARWENSDYRQMESGTLSFDSADADLIHAALEKRAAQAARAEPAPH